MKQTVKLISGLVLALAFIGTVTLLVIKYFDVLMRIYDDVRGQFGGKKMRFCEGDACCDMSECDEDDLSAPFDEE